MATHRTVLTLLIIVSGTIPVNAQQNTNPVHFAGYANVSIPSSDFKKAIDNDTGGVGVGFGFNVLANPYGRKRSSPVLLGIDFNYLTFGRDKIEASGNVPPYKTSYNYYTIGGLGRYVIPKTSGFTPFIDGMLGMKIYNTRTKIDKDAFQTVIDNEQEEVINSNNDTGLTYGIGVGFFNRKFSTSENGDAVTSNNVSFTLRLMYLWGDEIGYVKRGTVVVENGFVSYETGYTKTNMILIQLGFYVF
jgi:opacity protein-like surface antigen